MQLWKRVMAALPLFAAAGCSADKVVTIQSPAPNVSYTIETYRGHGPVSNDFTRVYAQFRNAQKTSRQLVMEGEYLETSKISWKSPEDVDICIPDGGITSTFRNLVTLQTGEITAVNIHNHLKENC